MIENLVQKYGKELINELIGIIIIKGNFKGVDLKPLLLKHKIITRNTKTVHASHNKYRVNDDVENYLIVRNGSGRVLINMKFKNSELPSITKLLNN